MNKNTVCLLILTLLCNCATFAQQPAAENIEAYVADLQGKKIGLATNHTGRVGDRHLLDALLQHDVDVVKIYAPEHGFRGTAGAGETLDDTKDKLTGIPVISLYGTSKKPTAAQLAGIERMVFDMQDVGARFYTYLSTLHCLMEACAENGIPLTVLDRPNPNGFYIDGPVLEASCRSFVGMHPIPVVHGMTLGELALMINGEKWLANGIQCELTVIKCTNYTHKSRYRLPVRPSPNLPDMQSIYLYPTLCFFEGTPLSVGRGTAFPFQVIGHPNFADRKGYRFTFVPTTGDGKLRPLLEGQTCYGKDFRDCDVSEIHELNLDLLIQTYKDYEPKSQYFKKMFALLAGNTTLQQQIAAGKTATEIRASWQSKLNDFKAKRKKYLLYPDFNEKI